MRNKETLDKINLRKYTTLTQALFSFLASSQIQEIEIQIKRKQKKQTNGDALYPSSPGVLVSLMTVVLLILCTPCEHSA